MNTINDFDRRAAAWLADGPTELSDRVLDAALREVHLTNQRRRWSAPWRTPLMSTYTRLGAAAAIVAVVGVGVLVYANRAPTTGGQPTPVPTIQSTLPPLSEGVLAPGRYAYDAIGLRVIVTVPAGWEGGGFHVSKSVAGALPGDASLGFRQPDIIYTDPCSEASLQLVGPTVDDLVTALADLPNVTAATQDGVTISGFEGRHLDFTVDTEGVECLPNLPGEMALYAQGGFVRTAGNGQHQQLWIVDVAGTRLVIDASTLPGTSASVLAELQAMVDTLVIEPDE